jgi:hypothetical protein
MEYPKDRLQKSPAANQLLRLLGSQSVSTYANLDYPVVSVDAHRK